MNTITTNRNYYRLNKNGQLPIVVLTNSFSPVLAALLEQSLATDCHYHIDEVISTTPFELNMAHPAQVHVIDPDKFLSTENYQQRLKHHLVDISPEMIALIDFCPTELGDIPKHFRGRILNYYWHQPDSMLQWLKIPLLKRDSPKNEELRIGFIDDNNEPGPTVCHINLGLDSPLTESQANSLACQAYTAILDWCGDQRILLENDKVYFDGKALGKTGMIYPV